MLNNGSGFIIGGAGRDSALRESGKDNVEVARCLDYFSELIAHLDVRKGVLDDATAVYVIGINPRR